MRRIFVLALLVLLASAALLFAGSPPDARASVWPGWSALKTVVTTPAGDRYVAEAAAELTTRMGSIGAGALVISDVDIDGPAIRLKVDPDEPRLKGLREESVWLYSGDDGLHVVGKSPLAVRHGTYILLEKLGFRWYFKHPAWSITPDRLRSLEGLDEVHEPAFDFRLIWHNSIDDGGWGVEGLYTLWRQRNRLDGARNYEVYHSYDQILKAADASAPDSAFCPARDAVWPRQLDPRDPYVALRASEFGAARLARAPAPTAHFDEALPAAVVPVSPNDGRGWCTDLMLDPLSLTDAVFELANSVARDMASKHPDRYVGVFSYNDYDYVPRIRLEPNVLVQVSTYSRHNLSLDARLNGFRQSGAALGVYDYLDVPQWSLDRPPTDFSQLLQRLPYYRDSGVRVYTAEASDGWGARGLLYYLAGRLLWDPDADVAELIDDFHATAFGPAAPAMRRYYDRMLSGVSITDRVMALSYADLAEAESLAGSDEEIMERIRHMEYYTRYLWLRTLKDRGELDVDGLKQLYSLVHRLRSLYVVDFKSQVAALGSSLSTAGVAGQELRALEVIDPPTREEAAAWMNEALDVFDVADAVTVPYVDILSPDLLNDGFMAAGNMGKGLPVFWPLSAVRDNSKQKRLLVVESSTLKPAVRPFSQGTSGAVAAGIIVGPSEPGWFDGRAVAYFFVPSNTEAMVIGVQPVLGERPWISVVDPDGRLATAAHCDAPKGTVCEYTVRQPAAGIWRLDYDFRSRGADIYLLGVPPLLWHDAGGLAVPYGAASMTPAPAASCCERRWE